MIAEEFSKILCIPIDDGLKRIRRTEYQRGKTAKERVRNVESAFTYRGNLKDKRILLIDDVMTTGATLNECSRTLKMAGSPFVMCMNLATTSITDPIKT
jgi:predicted amidophosphoribosyltransferase